MEFLLASTVAPHGVHLPGLRQPRAVHLAPCGIHLVLCGDHFACRGVYLVGLCCCCVDHPIPHNVHLASLRLLCAGKLVPHNVHLVGPFCPLIVRVGFWIKIL